MPIGRRPLYECKAYYPSCTPCEYRQGNRATDCPYLKDYYEYMREYSRKLGVWALSIIKEQYQANQAEAVAIQALADRDPL